MCGSELLQASFDKSFQQNVDGGQFVLTDEAVDPAGIPIYWVSKWVDYSDKYGLGYQLCDNSVGVLFNDSTRLILLANGEYVL